MKDMVTDQLWRNWKTTYPVIREQAFRFYSCNSRYRRDQQFSTENAYAFLMLIMHTLSYCMLPSCFRYILIFLMLPERTILMYQFMIINCQLLRFVFVSCKNRFSVCYTLSLKHSVAINSISPFISKQNINQCIDRNHDTHYNKNEKEDVSDLIYKL